MKYRRRLLFFALVVALTVRAEDKRKRGTEEDVVVVRLSDTIPISKSDADAFVWEHLSRRSEIQLFQHYSTQGWRKNYDLFSAALVKRAKKEGFEHTALEACLKKLLSEPVIQEGGDIGYLPIGAYRTRRGPHEVWLILCLWEMAVDPAKFVRVIPPAPPGSTAMPATKESASGDSEWLTVGHVRMFTYDLVTRDLIGFVTCD